LHIKYENFSDLSSVLPTLESLRNELGHKPLLGDFNGRTSDDDDLILVNERREGDDTGEYIENEIYTLDLLSIPRRRSNRDKVKNGYGKTMLDFCKGCNNIFTSIIPFTSFIY
jgi:hypothetical protein